MAVPTLGDSNGTSKDDTETIVEDLVWGFVKSMALKAAILLDLPDIIAKAGPGATLSLEEIAAQLPSKGVVTHDFLRLMRALVLYGFFSETHATSGVSGTMSTRYGLNKASQMFVRQNNSRCLAPVTLMQMHKVAQAPWHHLHESILYGEHPFKAAHGTNMWEYNGKDPEFSAVFNTAMSSVSPLVVEAIKTDYKGFKDIKTLIDVGGGTGRALGEIVRENPHIHGINFDLPHVVAAAPKIPGVEHVGGSMFESIPSGDAIFMKMIIHDWDEAHSIKILKNCHKALPEHGKVIISDTVLPSNEDQKGNPASNSFFAITLDLAMLAHCDGGMERTEEQWRHLITAAGFPRINFVKLPSADWEPWLIEAYKS